MALPIQVPLKKMRVRTRTRAVKPMIQKCWGTKLAPKSVIGIVAGEGGHREGVLAEDEHGEACSKR